jgi:DNA-binding beta-propeller fold protein YncE
LLLWASVAVVSFGCQQPQRVSRFPAAGLPIVWPAAPDTPRIRYVGDIVGEESFGVRTSGLKALGEVLTGPAPRIRFTTPMAVAVRGERAYVADGQAGAVYICDLVRRRVDTIRDAGGKAFEWPIDVVATDDGFAVCDSRRAGVFVFDGNDRFVRAIGAGSLQRPSAVAWRGDAKELWVLDTAAHSIVVFDKSGRRIRTVGGRGAQAGAFNYPAGVTWRSGVGAVVADSMNFRVQVLDDAGGTGVVFGRKGDAAGDFAMPRDVAVDSDGNIYVLDNQFENLQVFNRSGQLLMALGREGSGPGEFYLPSGITIDERDRIWVADSYNRRVQVFQYLNAK